MEKTTLIPLSKIVQEAMQIQSFRTKHIISNCGGDHIFVCIYNDYFESNILRSHHQWSIQRAYLYIFIGEEKLTHGIHFALCNNG